MKDVQNVTIYDNGACVLVRVNELNVKACSSLSEAWRHIYWMYRAAGKKFTVGEKKIPINEWVDGMVKAGYLE